MDDETKENAENSIGSIFDSIDSASPESSDFEDSDAGKDKPEFREVEISVPDDDSGNPDASEKETIQNDLDSIENSENKGANHAPEDSFSTVNVKEDEVKPFDEKSAAKDVMNANGGEFSKPPVLNKNLILYLIIGIFASVVIFAMFIFPAITAKREKSKNSKPVASAVQSGKDYEALAKRSARNPENNAEPQKENDETPRNDDGLPEVTLNPKYAPKEQPQYQSTSSQVMGGGYIKERPDTSEDSLQTKTINGIKGLTSTQKNYLTPDTGGTYIAGNYSGQNEKSASSRIASTSGSGTQSTANPYSKYGLPADRNEYTANLLSQYNQTNDSYARQNDQSGKNQFYQNGRGNVGGQWLPLNSIWQGTIFEATLTSNISTDLPGECTAIISKNVYSSQDGSLLLIPQNSKLLGSYNSSISYSQSRVQVGWHTLIRPDGYEISLGNMNATDAQGASGLKGFINDHPFQYLKALGLMSAFNIISSEFQNSYSNTDNQYVQNILANSMEVTNTLGSKLIDRAMDVQPTITIKAGKQINIVANTNLVLPALEPYEVTQQYHRER